jgi:integrase
MKAPKATVSCALQRAFKSFWSGTPSEPTVTACLKAIPSRLKKMPVNAVRTLHLSEVVLEMKAEGARASTIHRRMGLLRKALKMAHAEGTLERMPLWPTMPRQDQRVRWLQEQEFHRITNKIGRTTLGFYQFIWETGLRLSEALNLTWEDWNKEQAELWVRPAKTAKGRQIPLSGRASRILADLADSRNWRRRYDGPGGYGTDLTVGPFCHLKARELQRDWAAAVKEAGAAHCTIHDLRHTFATRLARAGVQAPLIAELLGHASIQTTMRYVHLQTSDTRAALEMLS